MVSKLCISSPLLRPFVDLKFCGFSLLKIRIGWVLWCIEVQICKQSNTVMPLEGGQGGLYPTRNLGVQLTLFQPCNQGGRLCPPHYCLPIRIWKHSGISVTINYCVAVFCLKICTLILTQSWLQITILHGLTILEEEDTRYLCIQILSCIFDFFVDSLKKGSII